MKGEPWQVFFSSRSNPRTRPPWTSYICHNDSSSYCEEKDARTTAIEIYKFLYSIVYVNIEYWFPAPLVQSCRRMPSTCAAESTPKTHRKPRWVPFHPCHPWPVCANSQGVERLFWYLFHTASKRTEQYKICLFFCSFGLTPKLCTCRLCRYWFLPLALFWPGFWWTNKAANCCELRIILVAAHDVPVWNTYSNVFIVI